MKELIIVFIFAIMQNSQILGLVRNIRWHMSRDSMNIYSTVCLWCTCMQSVFNRRYRAVHNSTYNWTTVEEDIGFWLAFWCKVKIELCGLSAENPFREMLIQRIMSILLSQLQDKNLTTIDSVGAFQKLPMVMPSADVYNSAVKKAKRVPPTKGNESL